MSAALLLAACTCSPSILTSPRSQATNVPLDVRPVITAHFQSIQSVALRAGAPGDWPSDVPVTAETIFVDAVDEWTTVTPAATLDPDTDYSLLIEGQFATIAIFFTTGNESSPSVQPPFVSEMAAATARIDDGDENCFDGMIQAIDLTFQPDPGATYHIVSLRPYGGTAVQFNTWHPRYMTNHLCGAGLPSLEEGQTWCATVASVSQTGAVSAPSAETCAVVDSCEVEPWEQEFVPTACKASGCSASEAAEVSIFLLAAPLFLRRRRRAIC